MNEIKNEDFNQIAAALAHEVKNPVALIKANIDILENKFNTKGFDSNIDAIKKQLDKITYIVSDFIHLFRPSTKDENEQVFIYDLINDIIEDYTTSLKEKDIKFEVLTENEDISLLGNYNKLSILFFNILKNAVEAIEYSGCIITEISKNNGETSISIKDSGKGISDDEKDKIMKPFVTTKKDGSGLGLSICTDIVKEYKGDFKIKNRESGGCEVNIILRSI